MSSRPYTTLMKPPLAFSQPTKPPTGRSEQCVARHTVSLPAGTGPWNLELGSSVCVCGKLNDHFHP